MVAAAVMMGDGKVEGMVTEGDAVGSGVCVVCVCVIYDP